MSGRHVVSRSTLEPALPAPCITTPAQVTPATTIGSTSAVHGSLETTNQSTPELNGIHLSDSTVKSLMGHPIRAYSDVRRSSGRASTGPGDANQDPFAYPGDDDSDDDRRADDRDAAARDADQRMAPAPSPERRVYRTRAATRTGEPLQSPEEEAVPVRRYASEGSQGPNPSPLPIARRLVIPESLLQGDARPRPPPPPPPKRDSSVSSSLPRSPKESARPRASASPASLPPGSPGAVSPGPRGALPVGSPGRSPPASPAGAPPGSPGGSPSPDGRADHPPGPSADALSARSHSAERPPDGAGDASALDARSHAMEEPPPAADPEDSRVTGPQVSPARSRSPGQLVEATPERAAGSAAKKRKAGRRVRFRAAKRQARDAIRVSLRDEEELRRLASRTARSARVPDDPDAETEAAKKVGEWLRQHPGVYKRRLDHPIHDPTWAPDMTSDEEMTSDSDMSDAVSSAIGSGDEADEASDTDSDASDEDVRFAAQWRERVPVMSEWEVSERECVPGRPWLVLVSEDEEEREEEMERKYAMARAMELDEEEGPEAVVLTSSQPGRCFWMSKGTQESTVRLWQQKQPRGPSKAKSAGARQLANGGSAQEGAPPRPVG